MVELGQILEQVKKKIELSSKEKLKYRLMKREEIPINDLLYLVYSSESHYIYDGVAYQLEKVLNIKNLEKSKFTGRIFAKAIDSQKNKMKFVKKVLTDNSQVLESLYEADKYFVSLHSQNRPSFDEVIDAVIIPK